jgi:hypothetical protein
MQNPYLTTVEQPNVTAIIEVAVTKYAFAEDVFQAAVWRIERQFDCGDVGGDRRPGEGYPGHVAKQTLMNGQEATAR